MSSHKAEQRRFLKFIKHVRIAWAHWASIYKVNKGVGLAGAQLFNSMGPVSWRLFVVAVLVLVAAVRPSHAQGCPTGCVCPGTFLTCAGAGLTRFPVLPVAMQRTVDEA